MMSRSEHSALLSLQEHSALVLLSLILKEFGVVVFLLILPFQ